MSVSLKLTPMVRFQTVPTGLGCQKLDEKNRELNSPAFAAGTPCFSAPE